MKERLKEKEAEEISSSNSSFYSGLAYDKGHKKRLNDEKMKRRRRNV